MLMKYRGWSASNRRTAASDPPSRSRLRRSRASGSSLGRTSSKPTAVGAIVGALLLHGALAGCAATGPELERDGALSFVCESGTSFRVNFFDGQVRVTTSTDAYHLDVRPSSIGIKYSSGDTTFILDEDRAVLTGADGGPFKRCHEV